MTLKINPFLTFLFAAVICLFSANRTLAASLIYPQKTLTESSVINSGDILRADVYVTLSVKEFSRISGQKLTLLEKLFFKASQQKLKKGLKRNPDLLVTEYFDPVKKKFKLDTLWFVLGFMIGPLALLFAWTSKRNKTSRKSAFLGFLVFVLWFGFLFVY